MVLNFIYDTQNEAGIRQSFSTFHSKTVNSVHEWFSKYFILTVTQGKLFSAI